MKSAVRYVPLQSGFPPGLHRCPVVRAHQGQRFVEDIDPEVGRGDSAQNQVAPRIEIGGCRG